MVSTPFQDGCYFKKDSEGVSGKKKKKKWRVVKFLLLTKAVQATTI